MKKNWFFVFIFSLLLFLNSCENNCDCEEEKTAEPEIYGIWERTLTDSENLTFGVFLVFERDGSYSFLLAEKAEGHSNSYADFTVEGNKLTLTNDSDCENTGVYKFSLYDNKLELIKVTDDCAPRIFMLEAEWTRVE